MLGRQRRDELIVAAGVVVQLAKMPRDGLAGGRNGPNALSLLASRITAR